MTDFFLHAKHWHVFLAILGMPIVVFIYFLYDITRSYADDVLQEMSIMALYLEYAPMMGLTMILSILAWQWSIGTGLQTKIPTAIRKSTFWFTRICIGLAVYYILYFTIIMSDLFIAPEHRLLIDDSNLMDLLIVHNVISTIAFIYIFSFSSKTIKMAETERAVSFKNWLLLSLCFFIFPVGLWIAQPKVQLAARRVHVGDEMALLT